MVLWLLIAFLWGSCVAFIGDAFGWPLWLSVVVALAAWFAVPLAARFAVRGAIHWRERKRRE